MNKYKKGTKVSWKWAGGVVEGTVEASYEETIKKEIKGKIITRHGSPDKPAYLVKSVAGNFALKLHSELFVSESKKSSVKKRPDIGDF